MTTTLNTGLSESQPSNHGGCSRRPELPLGILSYKITGEVIPTHNRRGHSIPEYVFHLEYTTKHGWSREKLFGHTEDEAKRQAAHILINAASFIDAADALAPLLRIEMI